MSRSPSKRNPRLVRQQWRAWYFYDFANSAFYTTVVTLLVGPHLTSLARAAADSGGHIRVLGLDIHYGSFYPYLVSVSVLLQLILLPLIGAVSDYTGKRKWLLGLLAYTGATATVGLYFATGEQFLLGGALFVLANLAFGASVVVYNAFLPDIALPDERDHVSSRGWALGYLGGAVLLTFNLIFLRYAPQLGIEMEHAVRICLASAGVWWAAFSLIPLAGLPGSSASGPRRETGRNALLASFGQLLHMFALIRLLSQTLLFLAAYLLYNDGIQSVIALAAQFGHEELGIPVFQLALAVLLVQIVGFGGSLLFGWLAERIGTKAALLASLLIWSGIVGYAAFGLETSFEYFWLAALIGLVLGGSQALSRSLFSLLIPKGQEAEFFSLYEISERGTSWLGPLLFGLSLQLTGSYRSAVFTLLVFFVSGAALLAKVNVSAGREAAERLSMGARALQSRESHHRGKE